MQQARQIGKVIVNYRQLPKVAAIAVSDTDQTLHLDPEATYLVTGGLSGFGLKTAVWLAEKGARQLVLVSRSGKGPEVAATLTQLKSQGVSVTALACDVTDRSAVEALFSRIASDFPPLKGVIHAATVFADALAINMTDEQIKEVMLSKMEGANILHQLTQSISLDLFVLFSSATTCFGNPGQSNYVAANHWLEALAVRRRTLGLAATCVRWGPIDDVGYLARNEQVKEMLENRMGGKALHSDLALAQLEKILLQQRTLCAVMELEWPALSRFLPNAQAPKFREISLLGDDAQDGGTSAAELALYLQGLSSAEQHEEVVALLRKNLSQILMLPEEQIDADSSVFDLGFDSLMGVELMVAIEERFDVQLPAMTLSEATTLNKLAVKLLEKLFSGDASSDEDAVSYMAIQHGLDEEELS